MIEVDVAVLLVPLLLVLTYRRRIMRPDALDVLFESSRHIFRKGSCVIVISRHPVVNLQRLITTAAVVVMEIVSVLAVVVVAAAIIIIITTRL